MPFTRQTPKTKSICSINQKVCSTKSTYCRSSSVGESHGTQFPSSKEQPSRAVQLRSLLSLSCKQHSPAGDQSRCDTAARIWLGCCPHQNGSCSARTAGGSSTKDQSAIGKAHSDTFVILTAYYSKWYWNNSYTPIPSPHNHHQTKLTSDRDFWQRMKSRNFLRSCYMLCLWAQLRPTYMPAWFKPPCSGFWGLIIWSLQMHYIFAQEKQCCLTLHDNDNSACKVSCSLKVLTNLVEEAQTRAIKGHTLQTQDLNGFS